MKKYPIAVKLFLLLFLSLVAIVYGVRRSYEARAHLAACYRTNLEKRNSLEPSTATINTEVQEVQRDQDVIDQLDGTDDDTVNQRRNRMIDGVKLKLTKVNKDRAEGQRRTNRSRPTSPTASQRLSDARLPSSSISLTRRVVSVIACGC